MLRLFVELAGRFQHAAYDSVLALLHEFQLAEHVVQEAFVAMVGIASP
jgi:hypothetical protein